VAIAGVEVRAELLEPERDLARRVRAVDDRDHVPLARAPTELRYREDDARIAADVAADDRPRGRGHLGPEQLERLPHSGAGTNLHGHVARISALAEVPPEHVHCAVLPHRREHLIAAAELQRARDCVQPLGRIRGEDEIAGVRADVRGERRLGFVDQPGIAAVAREEVDRLSLELELQALVLIEHGTRAGAEGAVIEVDDAGIK